MNVKKWMDEQVKNLKEKGTIREFTRRVYF